MQWLEAEARVRRRGIRRWLYVLVGVLGPLILAASLVTTAASAETFIYDAPVVAGVGVHQIGDVEATPFQLSVMREGSALLVVEAGGASTTFPHSFIATEEGVLVEGAGSGTRTINFKPDAADPNWGLTEAHLDKHLFGSGPGSLSQIDAAGNPDLWRSYIQDLASRPATATLKGGIQDVVGTFPLADGSGTFQFGIRIAPAGNNAWDLVTLLTRQAP